MHDRLAHERAAEQPQRDGLCGPFWALVTARAFGLADAETTQEDLALAAGTLTGGGPGTPPGEPSRPPREVPLASTGPAGAGTSAAGVVTALRSRGLAALPVRGEGLTPDALTGLLTAVAGREVVVLANLDTGRLTGLSWHGGHVVALLGRRDGAVVVGDSYPCLGSDGVHTQTVDAVVAAVRRDDGPAEGGLVLVGRDAGPLAELAAAHGLTAGTWDNGTPAPRPLTGQVGVITGGASGIGLAVAHALAADGMGLALLGRSADRVAAAARHLAAEHHVRVLGLATDVTDTAQVAASLAVVAGRLGVVDLVVHSAAVIEAEAVPLWEADLDQVWRAIETAVRGPLVVDAAVLGAMVARGRGRIAAIASQARAAALSGTYTGYAVGKRASGLLTGALGQSLAGTGVVVLDVLPGLVATELTASMQVWADNPPAAWDDPEWTARTVLDIAHGRHDEASGAVLDAVALQAPRRGWRDQGRQPSGAAAGTASR